MNIAAIDIGTNTIRLAIANKNTCEVLLRLSKIARLGKGANGILQEANITKALEILGEYKSIMKEYAVQDYIAIATSAVREASNKEDFLSKAPFYIKVINGLTEAQLSQKGILYCLKYLSQKDWVAFDLGGGSCEFIFCHQGSIVKSFSLNTGVVKLLEDFVEHDLATDDELAQVKEEFLRHLHLHDLNFTFQYLIGNAGTVTTLAAIDLGLKKYDYKTTENYCLKKQNIQNILHRLNSMSSIERLKHFSILEKGREDVIVIGAKIVLTIMEAFDKDELFVTNGSILEGTIVEYFC